MVLTWQANAAGNHVSHYNVYRTDQTFTTPWASPTATTFTNAGSVVRGKRYCYKLSATNSIGTSAKSAAVCVTVPTAQASAARVNARRHHHAKPSHHKARKVSRRHHR